MAHTLLDRERTVWPTWTRRLRRYVVGATSGLACYASAIADHCPNGRLSHFEPLSCLSRGEVLPDHAPDANNASSDTGFSLNTSLGGGSEELNVPGLCIVRSYLASPSRHSVTQPHILYIEPRDCHYEDTKERLMLSL
jgi:hypothetical protein